MRFPRLPAFLLFPFLPAAPALAGEPHRTRHHAADLSVDAIAQSTDGFLWLATGEGVYRFDGLHYQLLKGLPLTNVEMISVTSDGAVWAGSRNGLARFRGKFDLISKEPVHGLASLGEHAFASLSEHVVRIAPDGSLTPIRHPGHAAMLHADPHRGVCFIGPDQRTQCVRPGSDATEVEKRINGPYDQRVVWSGDGQAWFDSPGRAISGDGKRAYTRSMMDKNFRYIPSLFPGRNGQVWFLGEPLRGLAPPRVFEISLPKQSLARRAGYEDARGHLWVDDRGHGLVEVIPDPGWRAWPASHFEGSSVSQTVRERNGAVLAVSYDKGLFRFDEAAERWRGPLGPHRLFYSALPLPDGTLLASIRGIGIAHLSARGEVVQTLQHAMGLPNEYREIVRDSRDRLWATNKKALFRVQKTASRFRLVHEPLPGKLPPYSPAPNPVDLEVDAKGRLWAGYEHGLLWLDGEDRWNKIATDRPIESIRSFTFGGSGDGDEIWVAYRRNGPFSRLRREGNQWLVEDFPVESGHGPNRTNFLKRDSRGWIWRGTDEGVYIADGKHFAPRDWLHIGKHNGLAADITQIYGFREDPDGSVWICGEEGLTHVRPDPRWFHSPDPRPAPQVTRIQADTHVDMFPNPRRTDFPAGTRRLTFEIGSFHTSPFHKAPFLYRIRPAFHEWTPARGGIVQIHDLQESKEYSLEVAHSGAPLTPALAYNFRIGPAPAGIAWAWLLPALGGAALAVWPLRRTRLFRKAHYRAAKLLHRPGARDSVSSPADLTGQTLVSRYRLTKLRSRGGFADVYEATDTKSGATVAVKALHSRVSEEPWVKDRFAHEVAALRQIDHPGVLPLLDSWINSDGRPCLAMPLLSGRTLREVMQSETDRTVFLREIGAALSEVHRKGVVHRDLKPENILIVDRDGRPAPVLIDFGNAGLIGLEEGVATTKLLSGSAYYMAPEQLLGHYAAASDLYSFGAIVLEMLTGKRPAELARSSSDTGFEDLIAAALDQAGIENAPAVAAKLDEVFAPEPAKRPQHAAEWANALADLLNMPAHPIERELGVVPDFPNGPLH